MEAKHNELIKTYRDRKGIKQQDLAVMLDISTRTLSCMENNADIAKGQSLQMWEDICALLDIPRNEVF